MQNKTNNTKATFSKNKNQFNDNKHNVGQVPTPVLDWLKVFYSTRTDNKILEHSTHSLKITKSNSSNIYTIN